MEDDFFDGLDETKASLGPSVASSQEAGRWRVLYEISRLFNSPISRFDEILELIVDESIRITNADRGLLMLFDESEELCIRVARNVADGKLPEDERSFSQGVIREVLAKEDAVCVANVDESEILAQSSSIRSLRIHSVMCAPLKQTLREGQISGDLRPPVAATRKILGVIYVDSRDVVSGFDERSLEFLQVLANSATTAILNASIYKLATEDAATGLSTRRHFEQRLTDEVKLARRQGEPVSLLMVDVDHLRALNDLCGYKIGDRVLSEVAELCRGRLRSIDVAARYGGGTFVIILPQTDAHGLETVADKLLEAVAAHDFSTGQESAQAISVSVGGSVLGAGIDALGFTRQADMALFQAKRDGRNTYRLYTPELETRARRTDRLAGVFSGDSARDYRNCLMLLETIETINQHTNLDQLLPLVIDVIVDLAEAERGLLLFREDGILNVEVARDRSKQAIKAQDFSRSVVERCLELCQPLRETFAKDTAPVSRSIEKLEIQAVMCVPLTIHDPGSLEARVLGAIYVDRRQQGGEFEESALAFFDTLARQISVAIENARLYHRNEELREQLARQLDKTKEELAYVRIELADREKQIEHKYNYDKIIGKAPRMRELFRLLDRITDTTVPVFIHGESGTGKELVANAIHYNGPRRKKRLVSENCAAMSETLLESELFGYMRGSFTGAVSDRKGLFEVATGGTLFLDEVGDMSMSMQKKLLRVLQEGEIRRVGGKEPIKVDVRIISASNKDLKRLVEIGQFREDLYYRLNVVKVSLPPLRERREDIPLLAEHFLNEEMGGAGKARRLSNEAMQLLIRYGWPGNVRELKNVIDRAKIISDTDVIGQDSVLLDSALSPTTPMQPSLGAGPIGIPPLPGLPEPPVSPSYYDLNERQRRLVEYLRTYGSIRNRDYYEIMKVSKSTGWRDIKDLIRRGILKSHGKGKSSVYTLTDAEGS